MRNKKGAAATDAAAFIAITMVIIILYILFLPPDVRTDLLSDGQNMTTGINNTNSSSGLFRQAIGRVVYVNTNQKNIDIPVVRVSSPTNAQIIKAVPNIQTKSALFDRQDATYTMNFDIDKANTKNVVVSFNVKSHSGTMIITLNNREIYNSEINNGNAPTINLNAQDLAATNTLQFTSPSPGWAFWNTNRYDIENIQITGDITDMKNSIATQYFTLSEAEKANIDTLTLYFNPVCTVPDVGPLTIQLNRKTVFNSVADCGTKSFTAFNKNDVVQGANELIFSTQRGAYLLDNIYAKLTLTKPDYNIYYFDLADTYFKPKEETARCGDYDGICPAGCSDTEDGDCCFRHNGFWCALPTTNVNDRCTFYVASGDCNICQTGYYDNSGEAPLNCQGICGDNKDGICPTGCSADYDKDCCFAANHDNFWCQETPISGISDKCRVNIANQNCDLCPSGYVNIDGSSPDSCTGSSFKFTDNGFILLNNYQVKMTVRFTDGTTRKRVDINVNGHKVSIDTTSIEFTKIVNDYVVQGTNSAEIVPRQDIDIAELRFDVQQVSE